jgi:hypothetical protein
MNMTNRSRSVSVALGSLLLAVVCRVAADGQALTSAEAATKLVSELQRMGLDAIAATDQGKPGTFVAALYIPNSQLLVVSARHPSAEAVAYRIAHHQYRDVYLDLQGSPDRQDKFFVQDSGANGIVNTPAGGGDVDVLYEDGARQTVFNRDIKAQNLSRSEYDAKLAAADVRYARLLKLLTAALDDSPRSIDERTF